MIYSKAGFVVLITIICVQNCRDTCAYTQISLAGDDPEGDREGPKLYKAVNFDLLFPRSFNSSENVISKTPETIPSPTPKTAAAASVVGQPHYPLPQSNQPTYTAAVAVATKQQEPTLFVTPAPTPAPTSNEAGGISDDTQLNTNSHKYNDAQVLTQNAINMQEKQQQQQLNDNLQVVKEQQENYATGRAVDYHASYPFGQVITPLIKSAPRPVYRKPVTSYSTFPASSASSSSSLASSLAAAKLAASSNVGKIIYPQVMYQQKPPSQAEIDKLRGKGKFIDRFSPSEGVASHAFKSSEHHNHAAFYKPVGKTAVSASNAVGTYVSPSNLYAFPPNNVNYPAQSQDTKVAVPSSSINSYSWPASGSLKDTSYKLNAAASSNSNPYQYNGPVSADYLPSSSGANVNAGNMDDSKTNDGMGGDDDLDNGADDDSVGVLPASAMDQINGGGGGNMAPVMNGNMPDAMDSQDDKAPDDHNYDTEKEYPTPPPGWLKEHPEPAQDHPHHDHDDHSKKPDIEFVHDHDYHHQPDISFDHDHSPYHHVIPSFPSYPVYHSYPDIIYDDHHHDQPHHVEPPPPTSTEAPPPEPPPEPRVKKYSYFYIGRKLWYIPLYFTVWFSFYVLWLILKSIARHKVNLPNHYVSRRSVQNNDLSKHHQELLNQLTVSVLDKIDKFKRKYINEK